MKGVEELVSQGPEHLGISKAKVVGETVSSPALGQLGDFFFFFCHQRQKCRRNGAELSTQLI